MKLQFAHYWQEGIILNEEEREHKKKITQAMNESRLYLYGAGRLSFKWALFNCTQQT